MAHEFYMTIEGTKQGKLKGQSKSGKFNPVLSFSMGLQSPRDAATGQASGKRQHKPVQVVIPWTTAEPELFASMMGDETLKSVVIEGQGSGTSGAGALYYTIKLTNANIVDITTHSAGTGGYKGPALKLSFDYEQVYMGQDKHETASDDWELTKFAFTFQKISSGGLSKTTASDDWTSKT